MHNPSTVSGGNGYPGVELKDFKDRKHQFTLKFTNRTNKEIEYSLNSNGKFSDVYTSATDSKTGKLFEKKIEGATLTPDEKIIVPANSTKEVGVTLSLPDNFKENQYVEGFMTFTGSDNSHLKIPYMGFFGDWAEPAIFDGLNGLAFNPKNNNLGTIITAGNKNGAIGYAGLSQDDAGNYHIDPDAIALSTADGASVSWLKPQYFLFRNANDVKAEILNQDGEVINTLASLAHVTKSYWAASSQRYAKFNYVPAWDGTYFNQQTNKTEKVPDGTYTYRVTGTVDGTNKQQHYDIKIKVDSVKPEVKNLKLGSHKDQNGKISYVLKAEAKDNFSGLNGQANTYVNGELNRNVSYDIVGSTNSGYQKIEIPLSDEQVRTLKAGKNDLSIAVFDNATNAGTTSGVANKPGEINFGLIIDKNLPSKITTLSDEYDASDNSYTISGTYPEKVYGSYTDKDGKEHELKISYDESSERFVTKLPLSASDYDTQVKFYADEEHETLITQKDIKVSLVPAKIESLKIDNQETYAGDGEVKLSQTSENTVEVSGKVSADADKVTVKINDKTYSAKPNSEHEFKVKVPVSYGENVMNIVVSDEDGNSSSVKQIVKSSDRGKTVVSAADVTFDDGVKFGTSSVNAKTKNYDPKTGKLTLTGRVNRPTTTLRIGNQDVRVKSDGTFKLVLDLGNHGSKVFPVLIGDTTIGDTVQERLTFYVDANTPEVTLNHEKDEQGHYTPIYTNKEEFEVQGTISDDYPYYSLFINDNNVDANWDDIDYNGTKNLRKKFTHTVKLKEGKNTFNVAVADNNDNQSEVQTLVVYYKKAQKLAAPQITATTASDKKSVTITGKGEDGNVLYSTDGGNKYAVLPEEGLTVTENGKILFKTTDKYGNESDVVEYAVKTIEKDQPTTDESVTQARKELRKKLDQARSLGNSGKYTHESAKNLAQARQEASKVLRNKKATLQELTHAIESLDAAIKNLVEKPAEHEVNKDLQALKEKLEKTIKESEEFDQSKYTDDSVAEMTKVLDQARKTLSDKDTNVAALQEAFDSIVNAKQALKEKQVSSEKPTQSDDTKETNAEETMAAKNALKEKAEKLSQLDTTKYTSESVAGLSNALKKVNQVLTNTQANTSEIQEALDSLTQAEKALVEKTVSDPDVEKAKDQLKEELNKHKDEDKSQYTDDSAKVKENAEKTAEGILDSKDAQVEEVNKATETLVEAEKDLVKKDETKSTNEQEAEHVRASLQEEVNKNNSLNLDGYTPESQNKFKEILNNVQEILNDKAASSTSLENAKAILETAKGILTQTEHQVVLPKVEQPVNVSTTEKQNEDNTKKVSEVSKGESPSKQVEPVEKQNETAPTQNKDNVVGINQQTSIKNSKESSNQNDAANVQTPIKNNAIHEKTSSSVLVKPHTQSQNNKQVAPKMSSSKSNSRNNKELPKTGEKETLVGLIVTGVTTLLASVGIVIKRRNKN